jgi:hypothetical protein
MRCKNVETSTHLTSAQIGLTFLAVISTPFLAIALIAGIMWAAGRLYDSREAVSHPTLSTVPAPTASPAAVWTPEVRRAEPVPVTVKRAERVLRLGRWNQVLMPDGALTWVRFLGTKDTFADLPRDPQMGDA